MKNLFLMLAFMFVGTFGFASNDVELDGSLVLAENEHETKAELIRYIQLHPEHLTYETKIIDLGIFGCTSYVYVYDKDTGEKLAEFEYYDENCAGDMQLEIFRI